jgi:hypothetical protein
MRFFQNAAAANDSGSTRASRDFRPDRRQHHQATPTQTIKLMTAAKSEPTVALDLSGLLHKSWKALSE